MAEEMERCILQQHDGFPVLNDTLRRSWRAAKRRSRPKFSMNMIDPISLSAFAAAESYSQIDAVLLWPRPPVEL
jgi:hypothetical protein